MAVKAIVKDVMFLGQKSTPVTAMDIAIAKDLQDTLSANQSRCVGMAANMIGYKKNMIIVSMGFVNTVMVNPKLLAKSGAYETEEGCLSLVGQRKTTRYQEIEVEYQDTNFKTHKQKFSGYIAQIIQHEMDHLEGIII